MLIFLDIAMIANLKYNDRWMRIHLLYLRNIMQLYNNDESISDIQINNKI